MVAASPGWVILQEQGLHSLTEEPYILALYVNPICATRKGFGAVRATLSFANSSGPAGRTSCFCPFGIHNNFFQWITRAMPTSLGLTDRQ
jgi:hypothetical protein